jgi:PHD/YefM family antitoxin component YafN of YafNO toxin-antitoxin module
MLRFANIHSLSDFRQKSKDFIDKMKSSGSPLILTVNGRAELVVCESTTFQDLLDQVADLEEEVAQLKAKIASLEESPASVNIKAEQKPTTKKKA